MPIRLRIGIYILCLIAFTSLSGCASVYASSECGDATSICQSSEHCDPKISGEDTCTELKFECKDAVKACQEKKAEYDDMAPHGIKSIYDH